MVFCLFIGILSTFIGMKNLVKKRIPRDYFKQVIDREALLTVGLSVALSIFGLFLALAALYLLLA